MDFVLIILIKNKKRDLLKIVFHTKDDITRLHVILCIGNRKLIKAVIVKRFGIQYVGSGNFILPFAVLFLVHQTRIQEIVTIVNGFILVVIVVQFQLRYKGETF